MKSTRFTLMTVLLTGTLSLVPLDILAHGPDSHHHNGEKASQGHNEDAIKPSSARSLLSDMHTQIRFLEEDVSDEDLSRVHGYAVKIENLAKDLAQAPPPKESSRKDKARSYLRNLESVVGKIHQHGDAGRIGATQANVRKLRAQFTLLTKQYGFSFRV